MIAFVPTIFKAHDVFVVVVSLFECFGGWEVKFLPWQRNTACLLRCLFSTSNYFSFSYNCKKCLTQSSYRNILKTLMGTSVLEKAWRKPTKKEQSLRICCIKYSRIKGKGDSKERWFHVPFLAFKTIFHWVQNGGVVFLSNVLKLRPLKSKCMQGNEFPL